MQLDRRLARQIIEALRKGIPPERGTSFGSSGFMGISTANSNQNPLGATVTALPCRQ